MRIVIVEDEAMPRNGLINLIKKLGKNFEIIGEAANGAAGLDIIKSRNPDVVITDIKMPDMSGLDMIEEVKRLEIKSRFIILSGYAEFSYAQKGIELGVDEYLLKPITPDDLEEVLASIEKKLKKSLGNNTITPLSALRYLVDGGSKAPDEIIKFFTEKLEHIKDFVYITWIYAGTLNGESRNRMIKLAEDSLSRYGSIIISGYIEEQNIFIAAVSSEKEYRSMKTSLNCMLMEDLKRNNLGESIVCAAKADVPSNFISLIGRSKELVKWSIILPHNGVILPEDTLNITVSPFYYPKDLEKASLNSIRAENYESLYSVEEEFKLYCRKEKYIPDNIIDAYHRFAFSMLNMLEDINYRLFTEINSMGILYRIKSSLTENELCMNLDMLVNKIAAYKCEDNVSCSLIIKKVINVVREKYREKIILEELAEKLHVTPEYLSSLFNKEIGKNFSTYLKEYRIEKAIELMISTELKMFEIAERTGYSDAKYFCRAFKEVTGMSPKEYIASHK
jgi:two-component system response regulator YesN